MKKTSDDGKQNHADAKPLRCKRGIRSIASFGGAVQTVRGAPAAVRHEQVAQVPCDSPPHRSLVAALAPWACATAVQIVPVRTIQAGISSCGT